ncbi:unnamed protein product [Aureobasidium pullulans]|nr:unnamed protein product [Aureobasidium pullulans]
MPTILISGAASGLGRAFLNAYANEKSNTIIAIDKENVQPSEYQQHAATIQSHD